MDKVKAGKLIAIAIAVVVAVAAVFGVDVPILPVF